MAEDGERVRLVLVPRAGQDNRYVCVVGRHEGDGGCEDAGEEGREAVWRGGGQRIEGVDDDDGSYVGVSMTVRTGAEQTTYAAVASPSALPGQRQAVALAALT